MKETHFKFITPVVNNILNLFVEFIRFYNNIVLKNNRILKTLFETPIIKIHVSHKTTDGTQVKVGYIWSLYLWIVVHFHSLFKVFWIYMVLKLSRIFHISCIWTINNFNWNCWVVIFHKSFLSLLLTWDGQQKTFIVVVVPLCGLVTVNPKKYGDQEENQNDPNHTYLNLRK